MNQLTMEIKSLRQRQISEHRALHTFASILGQSPMIQKSTKISTVNTDVLITGESGTGKELFAQSIHNFSNQDNPFVRVNCPAIPFELADQGTIFLDEINSFKIVDFSFLFPSRYRGTTVANNSLFA